MTSKNITFDPDIKYSVVIIDTTLTPKVFTITRSNTTIGRVGFGNDLELHSDIVSKHHGVFSLNGSQLQYTDFHRNTNGTYLNGVIIHNVEKDQTYLLNDGDILRIDSGDLKAPHKQGVLMIVSTADYAKEEWRALPVSSISGELIIGRQQGTNCISIPRINVSRKHARIFRGRSNELYVEDLRSLNHTLLNGRTLAGSALLEERDVISVCSTRIIYTSGILLYNVPKGSASVAIDPYSAISSSFIPQQGNVIRLSRLKRTVKDASSPGGTKTILDLSQNEITIRPGELVAIIGGSGAGKTTLMNCMNAFEPADFGDVFINGNSLYKNRDAFRLQIGYVPQQDIVHDELTVREMLTYIARLRLPRGLSKQEIDAQINASLKAVELEKHENTMIRQLSGGQKKRSSIAVEMIADPTIFFLDEPTSGLDPEMEQSLIAQLRDYAHNGAKTVVVVTHTLQSIKLYDKIIFLAPSVNGSGGRLAFFGSYSEAMKYFGVDDIVEAYKKVTREPQKYADRFLSYIPRR